MNIFFLIFHGFSESSGVSKKILSQIKGMRELGHHVDVCTYSVTCEGNRVRMINDRIIQNYGKSRWAAIRKKVDFHTIEEYVSNNPIDFIYVRSFHNAHPFTIHLFDSFRKKGVKIVMEIPTYPYDQEYKGFSFATRFGIQIDKLFRRKLAQKINAIVTFSNHDEIFGKRTIRIANGVDFESIPLQNKSGHSDHVIHLTGVAEVHYWHGYDRLIAGLGEYYQTAPEKEVYFHIIGGIGPSEMYDSVHAPGFHELIEKYGIAKYIIFHGSKYGDELDDFFNDTDVAIGSLGRHRCGITHIKTLKNREYAARGIPFIYSETDSDFENMPYILKVPADESPVDIPTLLDFYRKVDIQPAMIRNSIRQLSWKEQMKIVIKQALR